MTTDRVIPDLWQKLSTQVDFSRGPLTNAQQDLIPHALAAAIGGVPEALFVDERTEDALYAIYWVNGNVFGMLQVPTIDAGFSGTPELIGWVRPISEVSRFDLRVVAQRAPVVVSDIDVRLDATIHWRSDEAEVRIDGTFSGNHWARDAAIDLIKHALRRIGAAIDDPVS